MKKLLVLLLMIGAATLSHAACSSPGYTTNITSSQYNAVASALILAPPSGCSWKVVDVSGSMATYGGTGHPNGIALLEVVSGGCASNSVLWQNYLAVNGTQTQADHITQSVNLIGNLGADACIEFTTAITGAYQSVSMTVVAF